jgi:hypothetical protein
MIVMIAVVLFKLQRCVYCRGVVIADVTQRRVRLVRAVTSIALNPFHSMASAVNVMWRDSHRPSVVVIACGITLIIVFDQHIFNLLVCVLFVDARCPPQCSAGSCDVHQRVLPETLITDVTFVFKTFAIEFQLFLV